MDGAGRNINRQRLLGAVVYFATNTHYCGKIKLFKLLYLLDFQHFRETGRSVTGADYSAFKFGPVPDVLMQEWDRPEPDFDLVAKIVPEQVIDYVRQTVKPQASFDDDEFTPRQLRIMQELAEKYKDTRSPEMIDVFMRKTAHGTGCGTRGADSTSASPTKWRLPMMHPTGKRCWNVNRKIIGVWPHGTLSVAEHAGARRNLAAPQLLS